MTNSQYKHRALPKHIKSAGPEARLTSYPAPLFGGPWRQSLGASDYAPATNRPVLSQHGGGAGSWLVGNDAPTNPQNYPEAGLGRTVMVVPSELAPGCALALRVVAVRSGMTELFKPGIPIGTWTEYAPTGRLRLGLEFWHTDGDDDTASAEVELPGSPEEHGAEPTSAGASWNHLVFGYVPIIHTAGVLAGQAADKALWSENTTIVATVQHQGGARVIHASLVEAPHEHVVEHDEETDVSIHGWPPTLQPTARPQIEDRDGADFEERRLGTARGFAAALRQSQRFGPTIAAWTSYAEDLAAVTDTEPDAVQVTSTSFVGLSVGSSITEWSADAPGYAVHCYAPPAPQNLDTRLDGAATIPVRCRVDARFTGAGSNVGVVRFQLTERSWVDVEVDQAEVGTTWTRITVTAWVESSITADDTAVNMIDFTKVSGGTMEVRAWRVQFGDFEVAA